eukprot:7485634-Karenia_brevis.AAC.1
MSGCKSAEIAGLPSVSPYFFDHCAYGVLHKKPTRILSNMDLSSLEACCPADHVHIPLRGTER